MSNVLITEYLLNSPVFNVLVLTSLTPAARAPQRNSIKATLPP